MPPSPAWLLPLLLAACSAPHGPADEAADVWVQLGVPAGEDGLDFAPLGPGDALRLQTFGQGGTHLFLGVRCLGFGTRAFVSFTLRNLDTLAEVAVPAPVRPQLLFCDEEGPCDLVPVTVLTAGLTEPGTERDGVPVEVTVDVRNMAGAQADAVQQGVLSTADL